MTKKEAIYLFGDTRAYGTLKLSEALGISKQAIYQWPHELSIRLTDEITGAAVRLGIDSNTKEPEALK